MKLHYPERSQGRAHTGGGIHRREDFIKVDVIEKTGDRLLGDVAGFKIINRILEIIPDI